jgi:phosphoglycerate-specific signal transduction histidine kinase
MVVPYGWVPKRPGPTELKGIAMNSATARAASSKSPKRIQEAATRTAQTQQELLVVEAELQLGNTVLGRSSLPAEQEDDFRKAVKQNVVVEEKVGEAAEELQEVTELLEAEVSERQRLERELERTRPSF